MAESQSKRWRGKGSWALGLTCRGDCLKESPVPHPESTDNIQSHLQSACTECQECWVPLKIDQWRHQCNIWHNTPIVTGTGPGFISNATWWTNIYNDHMFRILHSTWSKLTAFLCNPKTFVLNGLFSLWSSSSFSCGQTMPRTPQGGDMCVMSYFVLSDGSDRSLSVSITMMEVAMKTGGKQRSVIHI